MIAKTSLSALCAVALALGVAGCSKDNLVTASWAKEARGIKMPKVPTEDGPGEVLASYTQEGEPDVDSLESLSYEEDLGDVTVKLEAGQYELVEPVHLTAEHVVIEGDSLHTTQLLLDSESLTTVLIQGAKTVTLRNLTLIGLSGGGFKLRECGEVLIEDVNVVGARWGFDIDEATTQITRCVFAGNHESLKQKHGELTITDSCFAKNWVALQGRATLHLEACAFVENADKAVAMRLNARSKVLTNLFAGERQDLGWNGKPGEARDNLANLRDISDRLGRRTNLPITHFQEFPNDLKHGMPLGFQLARVHLALQRWQLRGASDPSRALDDFCEDQALRYGIASQQALTSNEMEKAKRAARLGLAYWGTRPLDEAPEELLNVAELGRAD